MIYFKPGQSQYQLLKLSILFSINIILKKLIKIFVINIHNNYKLSENYQSIYWTAFF
jgi:hypothetical protein